MVVRGCVIFDVYFPTSHSAYKSVRTTTSEIRHMPAHPISASVFSSVTLRGRWLHQKTPVTQQIFLQLLDGFALLSDDSFLFFNNSLHLLDRFLLLLDNSFLCFVLTGEQLNRCSIPSEDLDIREQKTRLMPMYF